MNSPDHLVVLSLLAAGAFFALSAAVLGWASSRFRLAIRGDEPHDFGDEPEWMSPPEAASKSGLQSVDGVVGVSRAVGRSSRRARV